MPRQAESTEPFHPSAVCLTHIHMLINSLVEQGETINFNAGLRTHSVNMKVEDYLRIENPRQGTFVEDDEPESAEQ